MRNYCFWKQSLKAWFCDDFVFSSVLYQSNGGFFQSLKFFELCSNSNMVFWAFLLVNQISDISWRPTAQCLQIRDIVQGNNILSQMLIRNIKLIGIFHECKFETGFFSTFFKRLWCYFILYSKNVAKEGINQNVFGKGYISNSFLLFKCIFWQLYCNSLLHISQKRLRSSVLKITREKW